MDAEEVARAVAGFPALPHGKRPFRVTVDPTDGGAGGINSVNRRGAVQQELAQEVSAIFAKEAGQSRWILGAAPAVLSLE